MSYTCRRTTPSRYGVLRSIRIRPSIIRATSRARRRFPSASASRSARPGAAAGAGAAAGVITTSTSTTTTTSTGTRISGRATPTSVTAATGSTGPNIGAARRIATGPRPTATAARLGATRSRSGRRARASRCSGRAAACEVALWARRAWATGPSAAIWAAAPGAASATARGRHRSAAAGRIASARAISRGAAGPVVEAPLATAADSAARARGRAAAAARRAGGVPECRAAVAECRVAVAAAAADADNEEDQVKSALHTRTLSRIPFVAAAVVCGLAVTSLAATAQAPAPTPRPPAATARPATPAPRPVASASVKTFATAKQAADALIAAAKTFDVGKLQELFGPDIEGIVQLDNYAQARQITSEFVAKADEKTSISVAPGTGTRAFLLVGDGDWPFPIPIVKRGARWSFDAEAGRQEIRNRRIGRNELDAIQIARGYVEAQHEYAHRLRAGQLTQYAQRIISTPGTQDGLAWRKPDGSWDGPIGEAVARAIEQGYSSRSEPYHGYFFKILKGQGPAAPLGQLDFVVNKVMIGGFALVAAPAAYGITGLKTFIVSHDGVVYEKDLGTATLDEFTKMERFNPDRTWSPVEEP